MYYFKPILTKCHLCHIMEIIISLYQKWLLLVLWLCTRILKKGKNMKKILKIISISFIIIFILFYVGCENSCIKPTPPPTPCFPKHGYNLYGYYYYGYGYRTKYTAQEHVKRIEEATEEYFAKELKNGALLSYEVFNVYSFTENEEPTNFCIEMTWANHAAYMDGKTNFPYDIDEPESYAYIIGSILDDTYRVWHKDRLLTCWNGKSYYTLSGARERNDKLYYSTNFFDEGKSFNESFFACKQGDLYVGGVLNASKDRWSFPCEYTERSLNENDIEKLENTFFTLGRYDFSVEYKRT